MICNLKRDDYKEGFGEINMSHKPLPESHNIVVKEYVILYQQFSMAFDIPAIA